MKYVVPDSTVFGVQNITSHHYHTPPHVCFLIRRRDLYTSIDASMTRENHYLFPDTFYTAPLETWAAAIQRLASEARKCLLEQVVHYKALSDMEHEFLVVYASHPSGSKIVLGIDRNAQDFVSAASKLKRASASQGTDTTQPSTAKTVASSSALYLNTLMSAKLTPLYSSSSSSSGEESSHLAYDGVQVSHDRTRAPILAQHAPCVPLYTVTFASIDRVLDVQRARWPLRCVQCGKALRRGGSGPNQVRLSGLHPERHRGEAKILGLAVIRR